MVTPHRKFWCSSILILSFFYIKKAESSIGSYQLLTNPNSTRPFKDKGQSVVVSVEIQNTKDADKKIKSKEKQVVEGGSSEGVRTKREDSASHGKKTKLRARVMPYDPDPLEFQSLYMGYYNKQPKRTLRKVKSKRNAYPLYDASSTLNDFTKDDIVELLDYKEYLKRRNKRSLLRPILEDLRPKPTLFSAETNASEKLLSRFDELYKEITSDLKKITELQSEVASNRNSTADQKRCASFESKNSKICCNPEKPSIVLDSSSSPSQVVHIDRNTIEEIIQVDIPKSLPSKPQSALKQGKYNTKALANFAIEMALKNQLTPLKLNSTG